MTQSVINMQMDAAGGADELTLASGSNILQVSNLESITGNAGADQITLRTAVANGVFNLGAGHDRPHRPRRRRQQPDYNCSRNRHRWHRR